MRILGAQVLAFAQRLPHQPDFSVFQITQPAVNDAGGAAGGAGREIILFNDQGAFSAARTLAGNGHAGNPTPDDDHFEGLAFQRWPHSLRYAHVLLRCRAVPPVLRANQAKTVSDEYSRAELIAQSERSLLC